MEQQGSKALPLNSAYAFGSSRGLDKEIAEIRNMEVEWDLSYNSTVRRGFIVQLFQDKDILEPFIQEHWPIGATPLGQRNLRFYLKIKARYEDFLEGRESGLDSEVISDEDEQQFVAESDLRNVLAANLECIERGLKLFQSEDKKGIEFSVDEGRIDILATDAKGKFVVIELKLSRGRNKALGQLLYYMGWVDEHLGKGPCRGIIIAREIPEDLILAVKRVSGVSLFQYKLSISAVPVYPRPE